MTYNLGLGLREERDNGGTRVATDDGDSVLGSVLRGANDGSDKGRSADNVKVGDTKEPVYQFCSFLSLASKGIPTSWGQRRQPS
jgi:hypothetical protein